MNFPIKIFTNNDSVEIYNESEWAKFSSNYEVIHAAGGIVENVNNQILMIYRLEKWDFPKGKVEVGEDFETAALREVEEETGLKNHKIISELPNTYHTYKLNGKDILKVTHWYTMFSENFSELVPQTEEDISRVLWVDSDNVKVNLKNSYPSLSELWKILQK